jgi:hypothetical protein
MDALTRAFVYSAIAGLMSVTFPPLFLRQHLFHRKLHDVDAAFERPGAVENHPPIAQAAS